MSSAPSSRGPASSLAPVSIWLFSGGALRPESESLFPILPRILQDFLFTPEQTQGRPQYKCPDQQCLSTEATGFPCPLRLYARVKRPSVVLGVSLTLYRPIGMTSHARTRKRHVPETTVKYARGTRKQPEVQNPNNSGNSTSRTSRDVSIVLESPHIGASRGGCGCLRVRFAYQRFITSDRGLEERPLQ
jgi:hypothetical protein